MSEDNLDLFQPIAKEGRCLACGQLVKTYTRRMYKTLARELVRLYHLQQASPDQWVHRRVFEIAHGGGDFAKLRYWGLVEEKANEDKKKKNAGYWKITEKGKQFVEGKVTIPKFIQLYLGEFVGFEGDPVSITDIIDGFDYQALMVG